MGCDIHLEIEQRQIDGWHLVPHLDMPCDDECCDNGILNYEVPNEDMRGQECYFCKGQGHYSRRPYSDRNYSVFAMLANVRNGVSAGLKIGDGFIPLSDNRGLPKNLSLELRTILARIEGDYDNDPDEVDYDSPDYQYELGEHSQTWLLYSELLDESY